MTQLDPVRVAEVRKRAQDFLREAEGQRANAAVLESRAASLADTWGFKLERSQTFGSRIVGAALDALKRLEK